MYSMMYTYCTYCTQYMVEDEVHGIVGRLAHGMCDGLRTPQTGSSLEYFSSTVPYSTVHTQIHTSTYTYIM